MVLHTKRVAHNNVTEGKTMRYPHLATIIREMMHDNGCINCQEPDSDERIEAIIERTECGPAVIALAEHEAEQCVAQGNVEGMVAREYDPVTRWPTLDLVLEEVFEGGMH